MEELLELKKPSTNKDYKKKLIISQKNNLEKII
jgi:hypothetical protein